MILRLKLNTLVEIDVTKAASGVVPGIPNCFWTYDARTTTRNNILCLMPCAWNVQQIAWAQKCPSTSSTAVGWWSLGWSGNNWWRVLGTILKIFYGWLVVWAGKSDTIWPESQGVRVKPVDELLGCSSVFGGLVASSRTGFGFIIEDYSKEAGLPSPSPWFLACWSRSSQVHPQNSTEFRRYPQISTDIHRFSCRRTSSRANAVSSVRRNGAMAGPRPSSCLLGGPLPMSGPETTGKLGWFELEEESYGKTMPMLKRNQGDCSITKTSSTIFNPSKLTTIDD